MKDMEREKFEGPWKRAFDDAEVTPSDKVWANIELDLERARGGDLKKRLLFFQMLAAASVVFAMTIGGIGYYYSFHVNQSSGDNVARVDSNANNNPQVLGNSSDEGGPTSTEQTEDLSSAARQSAAQSESSETSEPVAGKQSAADYGFGNNEIAAAGKQAVTESNTSKDIAETAAEGDRALTTETAEDVKVNVQPDTGSPSVSAGTDNGRLAALPLTIDERALAPLYKARPVRLNFEQRTQQVDPVVAMMAKLAQREREIQDEEKKKEKLDDENLWTSVGFAAGSFNTVNASSSPSPSYASSYMAALTAPIVDQESKANGYSYSMGVNVGTRISARWILQGGVNYLTHASEYTANNIVMDAPGNFSQQKFRAASTNELMMADASDLSQKLIYSAPYSVNNSMRYLSIPVQAGYLLVNKTFGLQLNAGVATDLFLQNTISAESDQIAKTSQPAGSDSPYRAVNLSGLIGTEVSYRFGDHYRVSLNPGIRYPFNTIYKSELGVQSSPLTFDVGLRFRYIFR